MYDNQPSTTEVKNEKKDKNFVAFIAIALAVASIIFGLCSVAYVGVILSIIAIIISVIFLVKKLGIKWFGIGAALLGFVGGALGMPITIGYMSAQFGWGGETTIEFENMNNGSNNGSELEEALIKREACLKEAGIDINIDSDDLADEQKDAYDICFE